MVMDRKMRETDIKVLEMRDGRKEILTTIGKKAKMLDGGISEFFHNVKDGGASICLRISTEQVKDINSAIEKAKEAGFRAEVRNYGGYSYLEISDQGYSEIFDGRVVEKLRDVAKEVSKEDYSHYIESLEFSTTRVKTVK